MKGQKESGDTLAKFSKGSGTIFLWDAQYIFAELAEIKPSVQDPAFGLKGAHPRRRGPSERTSPGPLRGGGGPAPEWPRHPRRRAGTRRPLAGARAAEGRERRRRGLFAPTGCRWSCPAPARGKAPGKRSSSPWPARAGNSTPRMQFVSTRPQPQQLGIQGLGLDSGSWSWAQALPPEEVCHQEPALRGEMAEGMPPMQVGAAPAQRHGRAGPWGRGAGRAAATPRPPAARAAALGRPGPERRRRRPGPRERQAPEAACGPGGAAPGACGAEARTRRPGTWRGLTAPPARPGLVFARAALVARPGRVRTGAPHRLPPEPL